MAESPPRIETALLWFRKDLRLAENPALAAAVQCAQRVIPVFIWAPEEEGQFQPGRCSRWWLEESLKALEKELEALGSRMIYRKSERSIPALQALAEECGASALFFNHLYDPISLVRDHEVKQSMVASGVHCFSFNSELLNEPWEVLDDDGQPFSTFDPFWRKTRSLPLAPPSLTPRIPRRLPPISWPADADRLHTLQMNSEEARDSNAHLACKWTPGSAGAEKLLQKFLHSGLQVFSASRSKADRDSTSQLSPHLHLGELSMRYLAHQIKIHAPRNPDSTAAADFMKQVYYREYSRYISYHFPFTHERSLLEPLRSYPYRFDHNLFKAWRRGCTGYPLVDAGMRQLWSSGWIHNRVRVVVASFLVKNLLLPWQWGLKHFWDALLDADLESDALGWQYVSGSLADAHRFEDILDLNAEAKRMDPDGSYVRQWLPMLSRLPNKYIYEPSAAPASVLAMAGVEMGVTYSHPLISVSQSKQVLEYVAARMEGKAVEPPRGSWGLPDELRIWEPEPHPSSRRESDDVGESEVYSNRMQRGGHAKSARGGEAPASLATTDERSADDKASSRRQEGCLSAALQT